MNKRLRFLLLSLITVLMSAASYAGDKFTVILDGGDTQSPKGYFTVNPGGGYNSKYTGTYDGHSYSKGLKINSSSSIAFTTTATSTVIIVQSLSSNADKTFCFDGEEIANSKGVDNSTDKVRVYTLEGVVAGEHKITNKGETGLLFVSVEYTGTSLEVLTTPKISFNENTGEVTISAVENASSIVYTTDDTNPSAENGTEYKTPFVVEDGTTVKAIALGDNENYANSAIASQKVSLVISTVAAPTITSVYGTFALTCETADVTFEYSTDGENFTTYTKPVTLFEDATVYARASRGELVSEVASAEVAAVSKGDATKSIVMHFGAFDVKTVNGLSTLVGKGDTEGYSISLNNSQKAWSSANSINGYTSIKVSNGAQNTLYLPSGVSATRITFYSYINNTTQKRNSGWVEVGDLDTQYKDVLMGAWNSDGLASDPDIRTYPLTGEETSINFTNIGEQLAFYIVLDVIENKAKLNASYDPAEISLIEGEDFEAPTLTVTNEEGGPVEGLEITYASSDESVATVDEGGNIAIAGVGVATITANVAGGDDYMSTKATVKITVLSADAVLKITKNTKIVLSKDEVDAHDYFTATNNWSERIYGDLTAQFFNMSRSERKLTITEKGAIAFELIVQNGTAGRTYTYKVGDADAVTITHPGGGIVSSGIIECPSDQITITLAGTDASVYPVAIKFYTEMPETFTISEAGYATYVPSADGAAPVADGVEAFIVTAVKATYVSLQAVNNIPAGTPIILKGKAGTYTFDPMEGDADDASANMLQASDGTVSSGYVLANKNDVVGFYPVATTIPAGKAYIPADGEAKSFLALDGDATAISNIETASAHATIYNVAGQRVQNIEKSGLYIVNGKKLFVK
ncbi:MAG: chitobiase/beta-hexosaminidase C-terminal domain-containing protein [Bacteroidaceae bacterium]|nr:chitobiase/beta-hexosaminidase C-terminal domain-containing protein [Bacteroidaceae bacterium]